MDRPGRGALLFLLVFAPALLVRLHPVVRESFQYDAITSQLAAARGIAANAWDESDTYALRRAHPPLLSYVILANNRLFGGGELGACAFSIVSGALTCALVAYAVLAAAGGLRHAFAAALFGGWMLALLPVHIFVSRSSNWDALYALFSTAALFALSCHAHAFAARRLIGAALLAALALATSEIGLFLAPAFLYVAWIDARRGRRAAAACWLTAIAGAAAVLGILWPAGLFEGHWLATIATRARDSVLSESNHPWHRFYAELFDQSPAFAVTALLGFGLLVLPGALRAGLTHTRLLPYWIHAAVAILLSLRQSWVHIHLKNDMFPPLSILSGCALATFAQRGRWHARAAGAAAVALLASSAVSASSRDTMVTGPEEHPGYRGIVESLRQHPAARTYYYYSVVMPYFWPEGRIEGDSVRDWSPAQIASVKSRDYDFVVSDFSLFNASYPDIAALAAALAPEYRLVHTVLHKRTREPVAWIFGRPI